MNRRSRFEIYMDIMLALVDGPKNPTRLMYATNLSWAPMQECLKILSEQGVITEEGQNSSRKAFSLTDRGKEIVNRYKSFLKDLNGLSGKSELLEQEAGMNLFQ